MKTFSASKKILKRLVGLLFLTRPRKNPLKAKLLR